MTGDRPIRSGEMHYPRIPRAYWRHRLRMARAMGLDAVSTYTFWNVHERTPGAYDFAGENDLAAYLRTAQEEGLAVILRPGPYVCAEWDFGGLPWWLLQRGARIRTADPSYMLPVRAWLRRLGEETVPLLQANGGPIVAVQLENEYGAFGSDAAYLRALRDALHEAGFAQAPLFTIDQPADLAAGSLDEVPIAATFAPGNPAREFERARILRPRAPLRCGEYWAGWFDHWGEEHHRLDDDAQVRDIEWMLREDCSFNIYMLHGGTNFGFWNGANSSREHPYQPDTTSYDYDAAIDEAGRPAEKYFRFREAIAAHTGVTPPGIPPVPRVAEVAEFSLTRACNLLSAPLGDPLESDVPLPMEALGQGFGCVLYSTVLPGCERAELEIEDVRDFAVVAIDGEPVAFLDRRLGAPRASLSCSAGARLEILVENCGRINYGPDLPFERKGITSAVHLNGEELRGWRIYRMPLEDPRAFSFADGAASGPALYRGVMRVDEPADTFLDVSDLGKGALWVNGRNAGRFWRIGPQLALYVPGVWLQPGENDVIALDLYGRDGAPRLCGRREMRFTSGA